MLFMSDFFNFSAGKYTQEGVNFKEFEQAYADIAQFTMNAAELPEEEAWYKCSDILIPTPDATDPFTVEDFICELDSFLNEKIVSERKVSKRAIIDGKKIDGEFCKDKYFGYAIYKYMLRHIEWIIEKQVNIIDIKPYCMIHDRMKCMTIICNEMHQYTERDNIKHLSENYISLSERAYKIVNMCIKYCLRQDVVLLKKIAVYLKEIAQEDYRNTIKLLEELIKYNTNLNQ